MKTNTLLVGALCFMLLTGLTQANAVSYVPDKIVPLPDVPYPDCTNRDSGTITFGDEYGDYIVVVENQLKMENWKEWAIVYTITPLVPDNWYFDPHIDYSEINDPTGGNSIFERLTFENDTAWWDVGIFGSNYPQMPNVWTVVGFPAGNPQAGQAVGALYPNPDLIIDTMPFDWNPEWVSLEFAGQNVVVEYEFIDFCIPEPGTLGLLAIGAVLLRRKRA